MTGVKDLNEIQKEEGLGAQFAKNPYAEWYLNSLRIDGTETQKYHRETYGENFSYDDFAPLFNKVCLKWDPNEMADIIKNAGAKYVVLVTKHHDGFLLWPSKHPNPNKEKYHASRNIVGELTKAVKERGMIMGFYYSGALDWSFSEEPIVDIASLLTNGPTDPEYAEYANNHWYELIDDYEPLILWNDIGYPPKTNLNEIIAHFYNKSPEGVINDRWMRVPKFIRGFMKTKIGKRIVNWVAKLVTAKEGAAIPKPPGTHIDFQTPEYTRFKDIQKIKWESTRGVGLSYGYNQFEPEDQHLILKELVDLFVDIVSKNGNLLLNLGPKSDGTIPDIQKNLVLKFGKWLGEYGEAIYGTKPWKRAEGKTLDGIDIRFTIKSNVLYAFLLKKPIGDKVVIKSLEVEENSEIQLLRDKKNLNWMQIDENLLIEIPKDLPDEPVYTFKITDYKQEKEPKPQHNFVNLIFGSIMLFSLIFLIYLTQILSYKIFDIWTNWLMWIIWILMVFTIIHYFIEFFKNISKKRKGEGNN